MFNSVKYYVICFYNILFLLNIKKKFKKINMFFYFKKMKYFIFFLFNKNFIIINEKVEKPFT